MRRVLLGLWGCALVICLAAPSGAVPLTYLTLDDPPGSVPFSAGSASGFVNPFAGTLDSVDAICIGTCSLTSEDLMAFTLSVTAGAVFDMGVSALGAGDALSMG